MWIRMRASTAVLVLTLAPLSAYPQTATLRPGAGPPEDPTLRAEAVRLLERANRLSTPAVWPPNELTLRYRVGKPAPGDPYEGDYFSSVGGRGLRHQEWHYGAYRYTQIRNGTRLALSDSGVPQPGILNVLNQIAPIYLVHFDGQDIIRSIAGPVEGTRCIEFDSVTGDHEQANEICVDGGNGWLLSIRTGDTLTTTSNFFPFEDSFLPGHIERWVGGQMVMTVEETDVLKNDYPADYFTVPESSTGFICQEIRMPFAVNTPQPAPGTSSIDVIDVQLQGFITGSGRVVDLKPVELAHPELNAEAIKLVSTWTYAPATCGGNVVGFGQMFTVHFKGR
jgi:hypothetical protein